jgi:tryptophan synthase beta chain
MTNNEFYWEFWGAFVPPSLEKTLETLNQEFDKYYNTPEFQKDLDYYFKTFVWRPTPITHLENISKELWWAQIYIKREDMTNIWAHKINHSLVQWLLAKRMWKTELIAETWAWMHWVSVATMWAKLWMKTKIFMWEKDVRRQYMNVQRMKLLWAEVVSVTQGDKKLKDAVDAALEYYINNTDSYYLLGSALGPYPYPKIVRKWQEIVWKECLYQFPEISWQENPDYVIACVWWGSNAIWIFSAYIDKENVKIIWVEWGWTDVSTLWEHAARMKWIWWKLWTFHGYKSIFIQTKKDEIASTSSISAGLDYPWIWPEHAYLSEIWRAEYEYAYDNEVLEAYKLTAKLEWILPALESSHALAYAYKLAPSLDKDKKILINLSGRWDKDLETVIEKL